ACAQNDEDGWRAMSEQQRSTTMDRVATELRMARDDLMGAAIADAGKTLAESDPEISEAIDFVEFYSRAAEDIYGTEGLASQPLGVVVVVAPWNFPLAIPCGGIAAALAAGNTVILKPASSSVLAAYQLCQCFWRGGISMRSLQLVPCRGATEGLQLVAHDDVDAVILTGGTQTALSMLKHKPTINLTAETGGKNATIVTALADRDQAIKNVIHSAFGHSGQKCSATSLLILEEEVYDDEHFKETLCDAVRSLHVGSAWDLETRVGPLIQPPTGDLLGALKELEPGESWAVRPQQDKTNANLFSPAVKWGVTPRSITHMTEFFGPVLGVMKARSLHEAIDLVNETGYGLTSGLESLDDREQDIWQKRIRAGNLYINRSTTGAIVLRQPFGGIGKSAFGPGIKAGGPNYVAQFMQFQDDGSTPAAEALSNEQMLLLQSHLQNLEDDCTYLPNSDLNSTLAAINSYDYYMRTEFGVTHDHFCLVGQDNLRRYRAVDHIRIRIHPDDTAFEIMARVCAAKIAGCHITVSSPIHFYSSLVTA
ncbi:MAG: aldehyde dehydrogenase family protein, partial [Planctomycetales bacterium]